MQVRRVGRNSPSALSGVPPVSRVRKGKTQQNSGFLELASAVRYSSVERSAKVRRGPRQTQTCELRKGRTIMTKLIATVASVVMSLGLAAFVAGQVPPPGGPPIPKAKGKAAGKKKAEREPGGELRKAYDLLRRLRADDGVAGRTEERLREWSNQAAKLYRDGLKAQSARDLFLAREYGAAAHDLARAVEHAAMLRDSTGPIPTFPRPPTTLAWRTPASEPCATCAARMNGLNGLEPGRPHPARMFISRRLATCITPRGATSKPAATSVAASWPVRRRR